MSTLLAILIVWFLVSIVVSLALGRVFTAAQDDSGTGRGTPQRLPSQKTRAVKDIVTARS